jgi:hypothetical protein
MHIQLNIYKFYWYFQQSQCLLIYQTLFLVVFDYLYDVYLFEIPHVCKLNWTKWQSEVLSFRGHYAREPRETAPRAHALRRHWIHTSHTSLQCQCSRFTDHAGCVNACAFWINKYYLCTRYKIVPKLDNVVCIQCRLSAWARGAVSRGSRA